VPELLRQSQVLSGLTYRSFEVYTLAMGLYFLLCYPVARGVDALYRRVAHLGAS
jgi:polar amino acid transport system permease protein